MPVLKVATKYGRTLYIQGWTAIDRGSKIILEFPGKIPYQSFQGPNGVLHISVKDFETLLNSPAPVLDLTEYLYEE